MHHLFRAFFTAVGWLLLLNSVNTPNLNAQIRKVVYRHFDIWHKSEYTQIFNNRMGVGLDFIYRRTNAFGEGSPFNRLHRYSFRPWIHYQFSGKLRFSLSPLGYFYTQEYLGKPTDLDRLPYYELRTTAGLVHHHKYWKERMTHTFLHLNEFRYRSIFEEEGFVFFRYRMMYRIRFLLNKDYFSENKVVYVYFANELFINYGRRVVFNMFNQNRIMASAGFRFLQTARLETRYVFRTRSRGSGFEFDQSNILLIGFFVDQLSGLGIKKIQPVRYFE